MRWAQEGDLVSAYMSQFCLSLNSRWSFLLHQVDRDTSVNLNHFDSP